MNTNDELDLSKLCRICLNDCSDDFINIFNKKCGKSNILISTAIQNLLNSSYEVYKGDGLSENICSSCETLLIQTIDLCDQILLSHIQQLEVIKNPNLNIKKKSEKSVMKFIIKSCENLETDDNIEIQHIDETKEIQTENEKTEFDDIEATDAVEFLIGVDKSNSKKLTSKKLSYPKNEYLCQVCNKKFPKRSNLVDHLNLHANLKDYKCEFCGKCFVQKGNYQAHVRIHTNERPYTCNICGKSCAQSSALKIHIRFHTNERNYKCKVCPKSFTNASDLAKHDLTHTNIKKFQCSICNRGFKQKSHLQSHENSRHKNPKIKVQKSKTKK